VESKSNYQARWVMRWRPDGGDDFLEQYVFWVNLNSHNNNNKVSSKDSRRIKSTQWNK